MNRNIIPKALLQKLFERKPRTTIYRYISKMVEKHNGAISPRAAAFLVAKELKVSFIKYLEDADRKELAGISHQGPSSEAPAPTRTIIKKVTEEIRSLKGIKPIPNLLPSTIIDDAKEMAEKAYPFLYVFENSIRNVISLLMEKKYGPNWWDIRFARIHPNRDRIINGRILTEKQERWHSAPRGVHKIFYADIDDLKNIIEDDWSVFSKIHNRKSWVVEHIMQLSFSRNIIAHNNPLKKRDIQSIQTKIYEWFDQIKGISI